MIFHPNLPPPITETSRYPHPPRGLNNIVGDSGDQRRKLIAQGFTNNLTSKPSHIISNEERNKLLTINLKSSELITGPIPTAVHDELI